MRYFIRLAYNGAPFHGWQRQPDAMSVQQRIEEVFSLILRCEILINGAGRTDTGVNASEMYAHFDLDSPIADMSRFLHSVNHLLAPHIVVFELLPVAEGAHARFDATSRTYHYYTSHRRSPFSRDFEWFCPSPLDYEAMNAAAKLLLGTHDFTSFSKLHTDAKTNICTVSEAHWRRYVHAQAEPDSSERYCFTITANRFLRNMVRAIVGTLVEVGRGKMSIEEFEEVIAAKDRCAAGESMPGNALFLHRIVYPPEIFAECESPTDSL